jgi:hypothetical protein
MELESLVMLPIDIVSHVRDSALTPFQRIAQANAVRLELASADFADKDTAIVRCQAVLENSIL